MRPHSVSVCAAWAVAAAAKRALSAAKTMRLMRRIIGRRRRTLSGAPYRFRRSPERSRVPVRQGASCERSLLRVCAAPAFLHVLGLVIVAHAEVLLVFLQ